MVQCAAIFTHDKRICPAKAAMPVPNMMPKPNSRYKSVPMQKSIRFFIRMLLCFFARMKLTSHIAKPACIKNTGAEPKTPGLC